MSHDLPSRSFTPLLPPPAGALTAVSAGRGIRRRRRLAGAGAAAASLVLVAGVVAASGAGSPHAEDQLVPAGGSTHSPEAQPPTLIDGRAPATARGGGIAPQPRPMEGTSAATGNALGSTAGQTSQSGSGSSGGTSGYRTPALRRTYKPGSGPSVPTTQQGPSPRVCGAQVYGDDDGFNSSSDWCLAPIVTTTSRGHDLTVQLCRDSTSSGQLTFARTREVELVVRAGSRTVWRWSTGQPDAAHRHTLDAGADGCWLWTAPWTDVDARGNRLPEGSYTLLVTASATEVTALGAKETSFQVH
jgi:hypothetical protein